MVDQPLNIVGQSISNPDGIGAIQMGSLVRQFSTQFLIMLWGILAVLSWQVPAHAAVIKNTITVCDESHLDSALANAQDGTTIQFACSGTIKVSTPKQIARNVILDGAGYTVIIRGAGKIPVFLIPENSVVTFQHLIISGGRDRSLNDGGGRGAIDNRGQVAIINCILTGNTSGLFNRKSGRAVILHTIIDGNEHGVLNYGGSVLMDDVRLSRNQGVGLYNSSRAAIFNSTISENKHGIDNGSGDLLVVATRFWGNAPDQSGPISQMGGGIANSGTVRAISSLFTGNSAPVGAALGTRDNGTVVIQSSRFVGNDGNNCFGKISDAGGNVQYPGKTCGLSVTQRDDRYRYLAVISISPRR
jgi:hypothetical protein